MSWTSRNAKRMGDFLQAPLRHRHSERRRRSTSTDLMTANACAGADAGLSRQPGGNLPTYALENDRFRYPRQ